jgi:ABC-type uncharacterized transport system permease subunit
MNLNYLGFLTISAYLSGALAQSLRLLGIISCSRCRYFTVSTLCLAGHGWILYRLIEMPQGQNLNWLIMLSFTLWVMNSLTFLASFRTQIESLCVMTYPLAALSLIFALMFGGVDVVNTKAQPQVLAHIFVSLFAMSLLTLASVQAMLMGLQNYLLKHHRAYPILRILPPLQSMETLLFYMIWIGVLLLSGALISGFIFPMTLFWVPKTLLALMAWMSLVLLLVGRYLFGWRGPTAIRWTISGTLLAFFSYFGTKALLL